MTTKKMNIALEQIVFNKYQIDGTVDRAAVEEIKTSLIANKDNGDKGLLQVTRGRQLEDGTFEQAFGRHRLIAFQELAQTDPFWSEMPMYVGPLTDLEMFELMSVENLHRRTISAIEEASIFNIHMEQFGHTSAQTASKFGKTEEYVRGAIRLLNLPETVKEMVNNGSLTKSTARDLLVVQKLGGDAMIQEVLSDVGNEDFVNMTDSIEGVIRMAANVTYLAPHTDWAEAKKFPVKHLNSLSLGDIQDILVADDSTIGVKDIKRLIDSGMEVTDEAFPQFDHNALEKLRVLANPPKCEGCAFYAVFNGDRYCGLKLCMDRKKSAWAKKLLDDKAKEFGIPFYINKQTDGEFVELSPHDPADKKLFEAKGPDLRLIPAKYMYSNFEGVGYDLKVVLVGEAAAKRKKSQEQKTKRQEKNSVDVATQHRAREITDAFLSRFEWEVVSLAFESLLDGITNFEFLLFQRQMIDWHAEDTEFPEGVEEQKLIDAAQKDKKSDGLKMLRRIHMFHAIEYQFKKDFSYRDVVEHKEPLIAYAKAFEKIAKAWDVKLPKDYLKSAEKYQAELEAALKELEK